MSTCFMPTILLCLHSEIILWRARFFSNVRCYHSDVYSSVSHKMWPHCPITCLPEDHTFNELPTIDIVGSQCKTFNCQEAYHLIISSRFKVECECLTNILFSHIMRTGGLLSRIAKLPNIIKQDCVQDAIRKVSFSNIYWLRIGLRILHYIRSWVWGDSQAY